MPNPIPSSSLSSLSSCSDEEMKSNNNSIIGTAIGIDLGTTYSCVGVWKNNNVEIIANDQGNRVMPSYVSFFGCDRFIGESARNDSANNVSNTIFASKRLIGRKFTDNCVEQDKKLWPFSVIKGDADKAMISVEYKGEQRSFSPEEISACILSKMKTTAENYLVIQIQTGKRKKSESLTLCVLFFTCFVCLLGYIQAYLTSFFFLCCVLYILTLYLSIYISFYYSTIDLG